MITTYLNGHKIIWSHRDECWYYEDGGIANDQNLRPCPKCGKLPINGHDACLLDLPGVENACCGHGVERGYIEFSNGLTIRFDDLKIEHD